MQYDGPTADGNCRNNPSISLVADAAWHGLIIMFAYYGESVLAVLFFAVLLSFTLSPVVQALERVHVPRALAALISIVLLMGVLYGITSASYTEAQVFVDDVPKYRPKIQSILKPVHSKRRRCASLPTNFTPVRLPVHLWDERWTQPRPIACSAKPSLHFKRGQAVDRIAAVLILPGMARRRAGSGCRRKMDPGIIDKEQSAYEI